ncbi:MAG: OsmC family protein [Candidatus Nitrosocaldaceae archaeon]
MRINNVDLDKISKTIDNGKKDKSTLKKKISLEGEWIIDNKGYQFVTELVYEKGIERIEIDSPSFLGGDGNRPGAMQYCIAGLTSCFIGTFVNIAASKGVRLSKVSIKSNCIINFSKTFDISDEPITESINFEIDAKSDNASKEQLEEIIKMAEERCPAIYSMTHIIKPQVKLL